MAARRRLVGMLDRERIKPWVHEEITVATGRFVVAGCEG